MFFWIVLLWLPAFVSVCRIVYVCWLVMFGWWGVLYCGEQFLVLLDRGVHTWIVGVAKCLCRLCGIMCSWGFDIWWANKCFFLWLLMYWAYLNFKVWVIRASITFSFFQKWLESFWSICLLDSHLSTYGNLFWATLTSRLSCSFVTNVCKFLMAPSCVEVGQLASQ